MLDEQIKSIAQKIQRAEYEISFHAQTEAHAEGITIFDLKAAISNGEILENYPDDPRGPSCLVLGYSRDKPIHIICGCTPTEWVRIITTYVPRLPKWTDERTRARGGERNA